MKLRVGKISSDGEVGIKFNQALVVPDLNNFILSYRRGGEFDEGTRILEEVSDT